MFFGVVFSLIVSPLTNEFNKIFDNVHYLYEAYFYLFEDSTLTGNSLLTPRIWFSYLLKDALGLEGL